MVPQDVWAKLKDLLSPKSKKVKPASVFIQVSPQIKVGPDQPVLCEPG
jgi:hypothetical protein